MSSTMKLLCTLITLAIVNVSPIMTAAYANSVYITNKYIKDALDTNPAGLETAISNIINGDKSIEQINLMWAIPDKANIFRINHDQSFIMILPEHIATADQEAVQEAIFQATNIAKPQLGPNENYGNSSLPQLGEYRRRILGQVTKNVFFAAVGKGTQDLDNLKGICRLLVYKLQNEIEITILPAEQYNILFISKMVQ
ncbi:uncharacterized protein LOC126842440 [Adelges cooleyi]|uniref:uncharacterized protein LOC126842440 n=1 Tax=Adelges cooleyi TaxID=133065 RepID=UPI00217FBBD9|nr:uncharacterized protein LOC126842440 [Adelges cooleyi]